MIKKIPCRISRWSSRNSQIFCLQKNSKMTIKIKNALLEEIILRKNKKRKPKIPALVVSVRYINLPLIPPLISPPPSQPFREGVVIVVRAVKVRVKVSEKCFSIHSPLCGLKLTLIPEIAHDWDEDTEDTDHQGDPEIHTHQRVFPHSKVAYL